MRFPTDMHRQDSYIPFPLWCCLLLINFCPGNNTEASGGNDCLVIIPPRSQIQETFVLLLANAVSVLQRGAFILKRCCRSSICMDRCKDWGTKPYSCRGRRTQTAHISLNYNGVIKRHWFNELVKRALPKWTKLKLNTSHAVQGAEKSTVQSGKLLILPIFYAKPHLNM